MSLRLTMMLPSDLRQFLTDLAGRLALHDDPGSEFRALRERYGYTQETLAQLLDLRRESLSRIESGRTNLTLPILQRFSRIVTLSRAIREHLAYAEARGNLPDTRHFDALATSLRIPKDAADEIVLQTMMAYEQKRKHTLQNLDRTGAPARPGRPLHLPGMNGAAAHAGGNGAEPRPASPGVSRADIAAVPDRAASGRRVLDPDAPPRRGQGAIPKRIRDLREAGR